MKKFILAHGSEVPVSRMGGLIALILWWGKQSGTNFSPCGQET